MRQGPSILPQSPRRGLVSNGHHLPSPRSKPFARAEKEFRQISKGDETIAVEGEGHPVSVEGLGERRRHDGRTRGRDTRWEDRRGVEGKRFERPALALVGSSILVYVVRWNWDTFVFLTLRLYNMPLYQQPVSSQPSPPFPSRSSEVTADRRARNVP